MSILEEVRKRLQDSNETKLNLFGTMLRDSIMRDFVELLNEHPNIVELNVGRCPFYDKGAAELASLKHIKKLSLSQVNIGDDGAIALINRSGAREIDFSYCSLTDESARAYLQSRVNMKVDFSHISEISQENMVAVLEKCRQIEAGFESLGSSLELGVPNVGLYFT